MFMTFMASVIAGFSAAKSFMLWIIRSCIPCRALISSGMFFFSTSSIEDRSDRLSLNFEEISTYLQQCHEILDRLVARPPALASVCFSAHSQGQKGPDALCGLG